jgi:flavin-dependent dehydrogenase
MSRNLHPQKLKVVILGAGVAGSILAHRLSTLPQLEVTCFEKVSAGEHSESGTGLKTSARMPSRP